LKVILATTNMWEWGYSQKYPSFKNGARESHVLYCGSVSVKKHYKAIHNKTAYDWTNYGMQYCVFTIFYFYQYRYWIHIEKYCCNNWPINIYANHIIFTPFVLSAISTYDLELDYKIAIGPLTIAQPCEWRPGI